MIFLVFFLQIGVDAGPALASCAGEPVTLTAALVNPPAHFEVMWEDGLEPGPYLAVAPLVTTDYRVFLEDLDTHIIYEDWTRVLVHSYDSDLNADGLYDQGDFSFFLTVWGGEPQDPLWDADDDGIMSILDSFYLCDHDAHPPNTPPRLEVPPVGAWRDNTTEISYSLVDDEQPNPVLLIQNQPGHGSAYIVNGHLYYSPDPLYTGADSFEVYGFDGTFTSPFREVLIDVDVILYSEVYQQIFSPICGSCHIDDMEGGLSLATYQSTLVGGHSVIPGITPGDLQNSYIWIRVATDEMPRPPNLPLSQQLKDLLRTWIEIGAPEF